MPATRRDWAYFNARKPACPQCKRHDDYVIPANWVLNPPEWYCVKCAHKWPQEMLDR